MLSAAARAENDNARVSAIEALGLTEPGGERALADIAALAADLFHTPMAIISVLGRDTLWYLARRGVQATQRPRGDSFCAYVVDSDAPLVVLDARLDPRFAHLPSVAGAPGVRFYAATPIHAPNGACLGAMCVGDSVPRGVFTAEEHGQLLRLARLVEAQLCARANEREKQRAAMAQSAAEARADAMLEESGDAFTACDRLAASLDRRFRDGLQRVQRQVEEMRGLCATPQLRALRSAVVGEIAALWDMTDEMAAVARLDAHAARRSVEMFAPGDTLDEIVAGVAGAAAVRGNSLAFEDATSGDLMLGDPFRFEDLAEQVLSDVLAQSEQASIHLEASFEPAAPRGARLALKLSGESGWETRVDGWRLSARSRELISAMAGAWDVLADQRRITLSLPARLRAPARAGGRLSATKTATHAKRSERSDHRNEINV
ncbi:MAG: GAF domain-containing protein [Pseudomonadota bacterium]